jgi:hypothetical protein
MAEFSCNQVVKICVRCETLQPRENFHRDKKQRDGLYYYCKKCVSEMSATYYQENREEVKARAHQFQSSPAGQRYKQ